MSRTYYIRRDGSATSNKPWSMDYVATVRAHSSNEAESQLAFLSPGDVFAEFTISPLHQRVVFCNIEVLRKKGMLDKIYLLRSPRWATNDRLTIIGISPRHMESDLLEYALMALTAKKIDLEIHLLPNGLSTELETIDRTVLHPVYTPSPARIKRMQRVEAYLWKHLHSERVVIHLPGAGWDIDHVA